MEEVSGRKMVGQTVKNHIQTLNRKDQDSSHGHDNNPGREGVFYIYSISSRPSGQL